MKIFKLTAENVKKIKAVEVTPSGNVVVVEGRNANGKTSLLDCIAYALGGKKLLPEEPIRHGEEGASISIDLGDYTVSRWWTANNKSYLKVEGKDGMKASSPQKMLDDLIGNMSFDPMEFCNLDGNKRSEILKEVSGISLDDLESSYKKTYDERTIANRDLSRAKAQWESMKDVENPGETPSTAELLKKRQEAVDHNTQLEDIKRDVELQKSKLKAAEEEKIKLLSRVQELDGIIKGTIERIEHSAKEAYVSPMTTDVIDSKLAQLESLQAQKRDFQLSQDYKKDYATQKKIAENLSKELEAIKQEKAKRLMEAKLPIPGLDFQGGDISFNGVEFSQISTAQRIKVSMAIAMALNPKIKIVRIMNGSLLDGDAMKEIESLAKRNDFQVWIERVSDSPTGNAIYIEDGEVKQEQKQQVQVDF